MNPHLCDSQREWGLKRKEVSLGSRIVNSICYHSHCESGGGGVNEPDTPAVDSYSWMEQSEEKDWEKKRKMSFLFSWMRSCAFFLLGIFPLFFYLNILFIFCIHLHISIRPCFSTFFHHLSASLLMFYLYLSFSTLLALLGCSAVFSMEDWIWDAAVLYSH